MVQYLHFRILKFYSTSVWCGLYVDVDRTPKKREKNWTPGRYAENILVSWFSSIFWDQNTRTRRFSLPWVGRRRSLKPWRSAWNLSWRVANDRRWALTALDGCGKPAWWFQWRKWWRLSISGVMDQGLKVTEPATSEGWLEKTYDWFRRVPWRNAALINDLNRSWFHSNSYRLRASQGIPGHPRASGYQDWNDTSTSDRPSQDLERTREAVVETLEVGAEGKRQGNLNKKETTQPFC